MSSAYRYIGSKSRLLPALIRAAGELLPPGGVIADLMCGTAAVSEGLRRAGYRVIASDLMTFATQHATARLLLDAPPPFEALGGYTEVIAGLNDLPPRRGLFYREYSPAGSPAAGCPPRRYLRPENAARIDALRHQLLRWRRAGALRPIEEALLRHDLVLATNRVANIAGTYGHYRRTWGRRARLDFALRPSSFLAGPRTDHRVLQGPAERVARGLSADLCYLDPPYMKRQYAANYHLLETLARGDEPEPQGVSGLRPWRDQASDFCSKRRVRQAFAQIITGMRCRRFLISYSEDGLLSRDQLTETLSRFGTVRCRTLSLPRFRSKGSRLGRVLTEYLFTLITE